MGNKPIKLVPVTVLEDENASTTNFTKDAGCSHPEQVTIAVQMRARISYLKGIQPSVEGGAMVAKMSSFQQTTYEYKKADDREKAASTWTIREEISLTWQMYTNFVKECRRLEAARKKTGVLEDIRTLSPPPLTI